jgi:hypothetical protein
MKFILAHRIEEVLEAALERRPEGNGRARRKPVDGNGHASRARKTAAKR